MTEEHQRMIYAVAYARVSTDDHDQNPESQLVAIRNWAKTKGITILEEFQDKSTGTNADRKGLSDMIGYLNMNAAFLNPGKITKIIVLDADRLSRNMKDTNKILDLFDRLGVELTYVANDSLNLNTVEGMIINAVKAGAAQSFTDGHSLKIKAGLERARQEGKKIGRPSKRSDDAINCDMLVEFAKRGYSLRSLEKTFKCNKNTLSRRLKDCGKLDEFKKQYELSKNRQNMDNPTTDH